MAVTIEVVMKKLLSIVFIVTTLFACGGEFTQQDKVSVDKAPPTEQSAMEHAAVEKTEVENKQTTATDEETTEQTAAEIKSDSAIRMFQGIAKSMY